MLSEHCIYCEMIIPNIESLHCTPKTDSVLCVSYTSIKKNIIMDFSGSPVVKNPPSSAGDMGSIPGGGTKIPHAEEKNESACPSWRVRRSQQVTTKYRTSQREISLEAMESPHATTKT